MKNNHTHTNPVSLFLVSNDAPDAKLLNGTAVTKANETRSKWLQTGAKGIRYDVSKCLGE